MSKLYRRPLNPIGKYSPYLQQAGGKKAENIEIGMVPKNYEIPRVNYVPSMKIADIECERADTRRFRNQRLEKIAEQKARGG